MFVDAAALSRADYLGNYFFSPRRHFIQQCQVEVAVYSERQRARDRGCGHGEQMGELLVFFCQLAALAGAEAMLFIDNNEREMFKLHRFFYKRVRADNDRYLAV